MQETPRRRAPAGWTATDRVGCATARAMAAARSDPSRARPVSSVTVCSSWPGIDGSAAIATSRSAGVRSPPSLTVWTASPLDSPSAIATISPRAVQHGDVQRAPAGVALREVRPHDERVDGTLAAQIDSHHGSSSRVVNDAALPACETSMLPSIASAAAPAEVAAGDAARLARRALGRDVHAAAEHFHLCQPERAVPPGSRMRTYRPVTGYRRRRRGRAQHRRHEWIQRTLHAPRRLRASCRR